jgi:glyoxylase-like metal-dependent hydrolase (beta-lactamase superfamily II)
MNDNVTGGSVEIIPVPMGFSRSFLLRGDPAVMVDCGVPGKTDVMRRSLEESGISPADIGLIIITHGHSDHVGCAAELRELTGARLAMHHLDAGWLRRPTMPPPPGITLWGRLFMWMRRFIMPVQEVRASEVDILVGDEGFPLEEYGVPGKVVWTPGHTPGSLSVVLESGDALVGDMAMNMFPLRLTPGLPIFAEDEASLRKSWGRLLDMGIRKVWPSHGRPFPAEVIARRLRI